MSKIKIKYFGPIKEGYNEDGGFMDVKKVTVFIGNQGSGKSTVAKVISTLTWMEKALSRGDVTKENLLTKDIYEHFEYQRIDAYFQEGTFIEYKGECAHIIITNKIHDCKIDFDSQKQLRDLPKIMYVPAERNFLTVVRDAYNVTNIPATLKTFGEEFKKSMLSLSGTLLSLPIGKDKIKYDRYSDKIFLVVGELNLEISDSSSGYQSLVPLFAATKYLCDEIEMHKGDKDFSWLNINQSVRRKEERNLINAKQDLTDSEKLLLFRKVDEKYLPSCLINVVEEPEQNLFPTSQQNILYSLLEFNNKYDSNKLIMTTHSPYLINYLTLAVKADNVKATLNNEEALQKMDKIVPRHSTVNPDDLVIYELDEMQGTIKKLGDYKGLPSDDNDLNNELEESNEAFAQLQEIAKGWR